MPAGRRRGVAFVASRRPSAPPGCGLPHHQRWGVLGRRERAPALAIAGAPVRGRERRRDVRDGERRGGQYPGLVRDGLGSRATNLMSGVAIETHAESTLGAARQTDDQCSDADERLRACVSAHVGAVWRALRRNGVPAADADDPVQKVFLLLSRKAHGVEPGRELPFLLRTAVFVASEARRTQRRRRESKESRSMSARRTGPTLSTSSSSGKGCRNWMAF